MTTTNTYFIELRFKSPEFAPFPLVRFDRLCHFIKWLGWIPSGNMFYFIDSDDNRFAVQRFQLDMSDANPAIPMPNLKESDPSSVQIFATGCFQELVANRHRFHLNIEFSWKLTRNEQTVIKDIDIASFSAPAASKNQ